MNKSAIVVGNSGQDGVLITRLLKKNDFIVTGINSCSNIDISNKKDVDKLIKKIQPAHVYYLSAYHGSSEQEQACSIESYMMSEKVNVQGILCFLDSICDFSPDTRLLYASSARIFGSNPQEYPQTEKTSINPDDYYGITKAAATQLCRYFRKYKNAKVAVGILYNHESDLRKDNFISKKIVSTAVKIKYGQSSMLRIGDLSARVDWGWAADYVEAMFKVLQEGCFEDFVIANGYTMTVQDFVKEVFALLGLNWKNHVQEDPSIIRLTRKSRLRYCGNISKILKAVGWAPKISFKEMIQMLVDAEIAKVQQ